MIATATEAKPTYVKVSEIRIDGGTQSRVAINQEKVKEYAALMEDGFSFEPVVVVYDGQQRWLADGFHRLFASILAFGPDGTIAVHTQQGTREDAVFYSTGANSRHGLPRSNADKKVAVRMVFQLILSDPDRWQRWTSSRAIAKHCGVSHTAVDQYRAEWEAENNTTRAEVATLPPALKISVSTAPSSQGPLFRVGMDGKKYPAPLPPAAKVVVVPDAEYRVESQGIDDDQEFFECKIIHGNVVISTVEESLLLTFNQAIALHTWLQENRNKLRTG